MCESLCKGKARKVTSKASQTRRLATGGAHYNIYSRIFFGVRSQKGEIGKECPLPPVAGCSIAPKTLPFNENCNLRQILLKNDSTLAEMLIVLMFLKSHFSLFGVNELFCAIRDEKPA